MAHQYKNAILDCTEMELSLDGPYLDTRIPTCTYNLPSLLPRDTGNPILMSI
jgi:hypothetical protein